MAVNPDFKDLLLALSAAQARFLVVGAHAVMFFTAPRYTKDLDLWVDPTPENAPRVMAALEAWMSKPSRKPKSSQAEGRWPRRFPGHPLLNSARRRA